VRDDAALGRGEAAHTPTRSSKSPPLRPALRRAPGWRGFFPVVPTGTQICRRDTEQTAAKSDSLTVVTRRSRDHAPAPLGSVNAS